MHRGTNARAAARTRQTPHRPGCCAQTRGRVRPRSEVAHRSELVNLGGRIRWQHSVGEIVDLEVSTHL